MPSPGSGKPSERLGPILLRQQQQRAIHEVTMNVIDPQVARMGSHTSTPATR